jgi:hypothetical protein
MLWSECSYHAHAINDLEGGKRYPSPTHFYSFQSERQPRPPSTLSRCYVPMCVPVRFKMTLFDLTIECKTQLRDSLYLRQLLSSPMTWLLFHHRLVSDLLAGYQKCKQRRQKAPAMQRTVATVTGFEIDQCDLQRRGAGTVMDTTLCAILHLHPSVLPKTRW